ncbi:hypothetical protein MANES_13G084886v8 [Manihot esculenta]|uniref:Uncharacterized protein n=1 Tax=Manihot esculenta TaxID=3983 RepID=A0ACB7GLT7_MANES|nr:hypothetical protein MANES_13G084886v8 [Manihot esculenta]
MPGRPKRNRKKDAYEGPRTYSSKLSKKGVEIICQYCLKLEYNRRACPTEDKPPTEKSASIAATTRKVEKCNEGQSSQPIGS